MATISASSSYALLKALADDARAIHACAVKLRTDRHRRVRNAIINLYADCGDLLSCDTLFADFPSKDVASWTIMLRAYAANAMFDLAVSTFEQMTADDGVVRVDAVAAAAAMSACAQSKDLSLAVRVHSCIRKCGVELDTVARNAMVHMYAECGDVATAAECFERTRRKNIVSYNSMLTAFARGGRFGDALSLFIRMQMEEEAAMPDGVTIVAILACCAGAGALDIGMWVHEYIRRAGFLAAGAGVLGNALVDMYAKCGAIELAADVFACVQCVLSACCHAGKIDEGLRRFNDMRKIHGVSPTMEHYGCVVDMLGRAGQLGRAKNFVDAMPISPDSRIWSSLLSSCKIHGNVDLAEIAMSRLNDIGAAEDGNYVLMSNMYTRAGRRRESTNTRKKMENKRIKKCPGSSSIEINGVLHEFTAIHQFTN